MKKLFQLLSGTTFLQWRFYVQTTLVSVCHSIWGILMSVFTGRSYELMEKMLKVYVYQDGEKPIFHQPILDGIYASEGWFMKHMEANENFVTKDPGKAHLFYLPFSSRLLELTLYVRHSHSRTNLIEYMRNYAGMIAAKYHFWNRTGGADHFVAACHDWVYFSA